ncbi:MAG: hypothetical protein HY810_01295 [Candidatus Omnitrophica bacterium]|nr:hypothetical protein [Candidatus Omnitrophota bacterium]
MKIKILTLFVVSAFIVQSIAADCFAGANASWQKYCLSPELNLKTNTYKDTFASIYSSRIPSSKNQYEHLSQLSGWLLQAENEEQVADLVKDYITRILGFKGVAFYIVKKHEPMGNGFSLRTVLRHGMKGGRRWQVSWSPLPDNDEKINNLKNARRESPYLHIKKRSESTDVYTPWLFKDIFLYRFESSSFFRKAIFSFIDFSIPFCVYPAKLGIWLVGKIRPDWLNRVNESLHFAVLDKNDSPIAQILINNWKTGEALFENEQAKKEKLILLQAISDQTGLALQLLRAKKELAYSTMGLDDKLRQLHAISTLFEAEAFLHDTKNPLIVTAGFADRTNRKITTENLAENPELEKVKTACVLIKEKAVILENSIKSFEKKISILLPMFGLFHAAKQERSFLLNLKQLIHDFEQKLKELSEESPAKDSPELKESAAAQETIALLPEHLQNESASEEEILSVWQILQKNLLKASSFRILEALHAQTKPFFKTNRNIGLLEEALYHAAKEYLTSTAQLENLLRIISEEKLEFLIRQTSSIFYDFAAEYKKAFIEFQDAVNAFEALISDESISSSLPETIKQYITIIVNESPKISKLNDAFFSKLNTPDASTSQLNVKSGNISQLLSECVEQNRPHIEYASAKNFSLDIDIKQSLTGFVNEDAFRRIIFNLLSNAVKYSPQGGTITVKAALEASTRNNNQVISVSISDTGIGIAKENLYRVGQRFDRLGQSETNPQIEGSAIGLASVLPLLEKMNGYMEVTSEGEGKGSCFTIYLPFAAEQPNPAAVLQKAVPANITITKQHLNTQQTLIGQSI